MIFDVADQEKHKQSVSLVWFY